MPTNTPWFLEICHMFAQIFAKVLFVIKIKINYHVCLCGGAAVTTGLVFAQWFVSNAVVEVLITYFTNSYNLHAVGLVNLLEGTSSLLVVAMTYMSNNHVRPLIVIICSTAAYIGGMVMLCISDVYHIHIPDDKIGMYFVLAVLLISVGKSGGLPILGNFLCGQLTAHEPRLDKDEHRVIARETLWCTTASFLSALLTIKIFSNSSWRVKFIYPTSVMVISWLLFSCCIPLYHMSLSLSASHQHRTGRKILFFKNFYTKTIAGMMR